MLRRRLGALTPVVYGAGVSAADRQRAGRSRPPIGDQLDFGLDDIEAKGGAEILSQPPPPVEPLALSATAPTVEPDMARSEPQREPSRRDRPSARERRATRRARKRAERETRQQRASMTQARKPRRRTARTEATELGGAGERALSAAGLPSRGLSVATRGLPDVALKLPSPGVMLVLVSAALAAAFGWVLRG